VIRIVGLFVLVTLLGMLPSRSCGETPNFVLIFIDDMGYGDIGPFGSRVNQTPNLDRMASEGMTLTSFYAAPVCSASRAQLLTGSYAPRVSVPGVFFPAGPEGLNPQEHTVADYLKNLGYATACVGKWHLGDQREFLPTRQGFDSYFGIPYSNDMGRVSKVDGRRVHPLMRNEEVAELIEDEAQRLVTRQYTEEAVDFIEQNKSRQFFLYLPHTAMHIPIYPHKDFVGKSENGRYGDWIAEVDWSVGQILETLKRHRLDKRTLVIFTSDNGPWMSKGRDGGVATPLRGSKGGTLEGGVREPTIAWWPETIAGGSTSDCIAGTTDVLPTFVALAGGELKADRKIDGYDLSDVLLGRAKTTARKAWHYYQGRRLKAVRSERWKLAIKPQSLGMGIREKPSDLDEPLRLYDLSTDLGETQNVAAEHPDVVARLQALANEMIADIGDGQPGPGVRPSGKVESPVTLFPTVPAKRRPPKSSKPLVWDRVKTGDVFDSSRAPRVAGKPFTIRCSIESDAPRGVILAQGGSAMGYVVYAADGRIVFSLRRSSNQVHRLSVPWNGTKGMVEAKLTRERMTLTIVDDVSTHIDIPSLLTSHPQEGLSIGFDERNPVDPQAPSGRFQGSINSISVNVEEVTNEK